MSNLQNILKTQITPKVQKFLTSNTFTVPENVYTLIVSIVGAGGGSAYAASASPLSMLTTGAGGGGGYYHEYPLAVTPGDVLTINVGSGGTSRYFTAGSYTGTLSSGGNSSIYLGATELLTAFGGSCGEFYTSAFNSNLASWHGGGDGGAPNGSGGGGMALYTSGDGSTVAASGGGSGSRTTGNRYGGSSARRANFLGSIFGYGEYANGNRYGGSTPFPAGHGSSGGATNPPGEDGLVILTWFE